VSAQHHERLDGTGYPKGLRGDEISLFGQMSAIVDIYDALTSERCYKEAVPPTEALRKIFEWSHSYLNRYLVEKFISRIGIYPVGSIVRLVGGAIAVVIGHGEKDLLKPVVRIVYDWRHHRVNSGEVQELQTTADEIIRCEPAGRINIDPTNYLF
jgi:HD-GYP domain-containing protein (c-di-GMP phosphodiesterase class II)